VRFVHPSPLRPMRLLRIPEPFDHPDFFYEVKFDGFRALAQVAGHHCQLVSSQRPHVQELAAARRRNRTCDSCSQRRARRRARLPRCKRPPPRTVDFNHAHTSGRVTLASVVDHRGRRTVHSRPVPVGCVRAIAPRPACPSSLDLRGSHHAHAPETVRGATAPAWSSPRSGTTSTCS
jgi:hypothetical protein